MKGRLNSRLDLVVLFGRAPSSSDENGVEERCTFLDELPRLFSKSFREEGYKKRKEI